MANEPATNALAGVGRSDRDLLDVGIPVHNSRDDIAGDLSAYFCNPDLALLLAAAERAHVGRMFGDFWHTYRAKNLAGLDFELCEQLKIGTTSRTDRKTRHWLNVEAELEQIPLPNNLSRGRRHAGDEY